MPSSPPRPAARRWTLRLAGGGELVLGGRPLVMGVLNVTPDSFSDGGRFLDPEHAVAQGLAMVDEGADLLDLGAESSRPGGGVYGTGAEAVSAAEEWARLEPVIAGLRRAGGGASPVPLSVDTRKGGVARRALAAGADLINDVSALSDPELGRAVAETGCPVVLMHSRGATATMQHEAVYEDVVAEVRDELAAVLGRAEAAAIDRAQTLLDPGLGYAKGGAHNLALLARLDELAALGRPLLVGASRKSFLGRLTGRPPAKRLAGSVAAALAAVARGAAIVRVHDVAATVEALTVWSAIEAAREDDTAPPPASSGRAARHREAAAR